MITLKTLQEFWSDDAYARPINHWELVKEIQHGRFATDVPERIKELHWNWANAPVGKESGRWAERILEYLPELRQRNDYETA